MKWIKFKKCPNFSMRVFFTLFIIFELFLINTVAAAIVAFLDRFLPALTRIPQVVWLILISAVLGSAITTFLGKFFFDPMVQLGVALRKVSRGDFDVQLDSHHVFREIRQINQDFNRMTKELSSTEILKTEFISNVSHEFKTPINAIEGYATLLQDTDQSNVEEQSQYIEKILFNTRRLSRLVGNILLLS